MFVNDFQEKVFQTLPGQGWQALIDWSPEPRDVADGMPRYTLEPVIAWVTAKVERENDRDTVIIAPLVRDTFGNELTLLDAHDGLNRAAIYLAPGETLTDEHFAQLKGAYRKGVEPRG